MDNRQKEIIKYFVFIVLKRLEDERKFLGNPLIRFVFQEKDLSFLEQLVQENKQEIYFYIDVLDQREYLMESDIKETIYSLKKNQKDYQEYQKGNYLLSNDEHFIMINDLSLFSNLLTKIFFQIVKKASVTFAFNLLYSIWLRMGPSDIENINAFLKRELDFIENNSRDRLEICDEKKVLINYESTLNNHTWFETNQKMMIALNKEKKLPIIHYAIRKENNQLVCYIYGIQEEQKITLPDAYNIEKKTFRNKYVKYTFLLAMKYFLCFLKQKGIQNIKVPLLQVFDYDYHHNLGLITFTRFKEEYPSAKREELEYLISQNIMNNEVEEYINNRTWCEHVFQKEDLISQNKTERLVYLFWVLEDKTELISILTDPFIEDEYLHIKIR